MNFFFNFQCSLTIYFACYYIHPEEILTTWYTKSPKRKILSIFICVPDISFFQNPFQWPLLLALSSLYSSFLSFWSLFSCTRTKSKNFASKVMKFPQYFAYILPYSYISYFSRSYDHLSHPWLKKERVKFFVFLTKYNKKGSALLTLKKIESCNSIKLILHK